MGFGCCDDWILLGILVLILLFGCFGLCGCGLGYGLGYSAPCCCCCCF